MLEPQAAGLEAVAPSTPAVPPAAAPVAPVAAAPAAPAAAPAANDEKFDELGHDFTQTMLSVFQDPQTLIKIGELAVEYQQPGWLDYLKRGHDAQKENAGTAVMKLMAGDTKGALQLFNASGRHKASAINPVGDGTYDVIGMGPDGKQYTRRINPEKEMLALLTPPQFIAHMDREKAIDTKIAAAEAAGKSREEIARIRAEGTAEAARLRAEAAAKETDRRSERDRDRATHEAAIAGVRQDGLRLQGDLNVARIDLAKARTTTEGARANYLDARAEATQAGGTANPRFNWNVFNNSIDRAAKDLDYVKEDKLGKKVVNGRKLMEVRSMAQQLARRDPSLAESPGLALQTAVAKFEEVDAQVAERLEQDAAKVLAAEPSTWLPDGKGSLKDYYAVRGVKNHEEWKKKRAAQLTTEALKTVGLEIPDASAIVEKSSKAVSGTIGGTAPAKPAAPPAQSAASGEPPTLTKPEEAAALPKGTKFKIAGRDGVFEKK